MEVAKISQKEYLKKYLSGSNEKKHKKKKLKLGPKKVKIIDDDVDLTKIRPLEDGEFDIFDTTEDAPQIAGVVDERGPVDFTDKRRWKIITDDGEGNVAISSSNNRRRDVCHEDNLEPNKNQSNNHKNLRLNTASKIDSDHDLSPRRQSKHIRSNDEKARKTSKFDSNSDDLSLSRQSKHSFKSKRDDKKRHKRETSSSSSSSEVSQTNSKVRRKSESQNNSKKQKYSESYSISSSSRDAVNSEAMKISKCKNNSKKQKHRYSSDSDSLSEASDVNRKARRRSKSKKDSKKRKNYDSDLSPPRKHNDTDLSPPRKRYDSDLSPPRKQYDSDLSPPRKQYDSDLSPPRQSVRRDKENKQGRQGHDSITRSPQRKNTSRSSQQRSVDQNHDNRYRERRRSPQRRGSRWNEESRRSSSPPAGKRVAQTLDGKTAGLQNSKGMREESLAKKKREAELLEKMNIEAGGPPQFAVLRKNGRRRDLDAEAAERREQSDKQKEIDARYAKWGKGLKQVDDRAEKIKQDLYEMSKPLARYADDADLDAQLRAVDREGDPMLDYIREKRGKTQPEKPSYHGSYIPNRFGIKPGHRWDGVDRSNGYEKKWFEAQNQKVAVQEEAYKWSTSDM